MSTLTDAQKVMRNDTGKAIAEAIQQVAGAISRSGGVVYGFHIDNAESEPYEKVSYLADAVGMVPAYMDYTNDEFNYGSWENAFFMPKPCMLKFDGTVDYYLDPNDYTKKADGTASDVASSTTANAMMEWGQNGKKIWYKIVPSGTKKSADVYIADHQEDGDYHAWSFINNQGKLVDHFYTPIYNGYNSNDVLRSLSGKTPTASLTAANERTYARANNGSLAIWDTEVWCDNVLIILLLTLIGKSTDSKSVFGQGNTSGGQNGVLATGTMNDKGLFWGSTGTTAGVKVFGMENFWGNLWHRFGGLVNVNGTAKYKMTRGTQDGTEVSDYVITATEADYSGYLSAGALPTASGTYVTEMQFDGNQFVPLTMDGSASIDYCDGLWTNNGQVAYALRGGGSHLAARCGAFSLGLDSPVSRAVWAIAAAPSCKPLS